MDKRKLVQSQTESRLLSLCEQGQYDQLEALFDSSVVVDKVVLDSCFLATCRAHNYLGDYENILMFLLNKGANVNAKEKAGERTGLVLAVQNNNLGLVKLLLENKADPNIADKEGRSALWYASSLESGENLDLVTLLLDFKAGAEAKAKDGSTTLLIALKRSFEKVSVALIKRMTDFSFKEKSTGNSYLHVAAYRNSETIVRCLLKRGLINEDNFNNDCKLPSDLTISDGILECLSENSKKPEDPKSDRNKLKAATSLKKPVKKKNSEKIELSKLEANKPKQRVSMKSYKELEKNVKGVTATLKDPKKLVVNSVTKSKAKPDLENK